MVDLRAARTLRFEHAQMIAEKVIARFEKHEFDVCTLFFSRFRSVIAQVPTAQQIIPPVFDASATGALGGATYEFEPEAEDILHDLLPRNIAVQIFRALLENSASFYGAQMSAMDNATRNAGDMIRRQTLFYNRTRQAMITKELIEIISGAEALSPRQRDQTDGRRYEFEGESLWLHPPTRPDASPRSSAPSSTCSSKATCRLFSTPFRPPTMAAAWCSKSPSISANPRCVPSPWTPPKGWSAAARLPIPAPRSLWPAAAAPSGRAYTASEHRAI